MRNLWLCLALIAALSLCNGVVSAQTTGAVTATCKDGTAFTGTKRSGACRGHGGVQSWGEPTTPTQFFFDSFRKVCGQVVDATPLLSEARAIKTAQEIERMRLANELAALAMDYTREHMKPGMKESEVGGMYESFVHYQTKLIRALDRMSAQYGFVEIDARKPAAEIFGELRGHISKLNLEKVNGTRRAIA